MDVTQNFTGADLARQADEAQTPLMRAKARSKGGAKVNACPYGCDLESLDEHGYCRHLVGFTNATDEEIRSGQATFEPMVQVKDRRVVQGGKPKVVQKTDKIVRITISARVYRDVDATDKNAKPAA